MINPFKATAATIGGMWQSASGSDCARGQAQIAVVLLTPIVAPVAFVAAFFQKKEK